MKFQWVTLLQIVCLVVVITVSQTEAQSDASTSALEGKQRAPDFVGFAAMMDNNRRGRIFRGESK